VYDAIARMKVRAHWQSDVIAGFVPRHRRGLFRARPRRHAAGAVGPAHGIYVGLKKKW